MESTPTLMEVLQQMKEEVTSTKPAEGKFLEELQVSVEDYQDLMGSMMKAVELGVGVFGLELSIVGAIQTAVILGYRLRDAQVEQDAPTA